MEHNGISIPPWFSIGQWVDVSLLWCLPNKLRDVASFGVSFRAAFNFIVVSLEFLGFGFFLQLDICGGEEYD